MKEYLSLPEDELEDYGQRINPILRRHLRTSISKVSSSFDETAILTALIVASLAVTPWEEREVLVFVRNTSQGLRLDPDELNDRPDLVAFFASREVAERLAGIQEGYPEDDEIIIPPCFCPLSIVMTRDCKDDVHQIQSYLLALSRHRPESYIQHGLIVNSGGFMLAALGLDDLHTWKKIPWSHPAVIQKLCSCIRRIRDEASRIIPSAVPKLKDVIKMNSRVIGLYLAEVNDRHFRLLPIHSRGDRRKPFVALGVTEDSRVVRVLKYSWRSKGNEGKERELLERLRDTPGVVHLDNELSVDFLQMNDTDLFDSETCRSQSLLALTTIGRSICSCESVLEFLEAMYDLLEVLRYVAQEENILHRDISWSNNLIRTEEFGGQNDVRESIARAHKRLGRQDEQGIPHTYRFISDIFNEQNWRVRITLTDFDHATTRDNTDELKNATGTSMFMASDVLEPRESSVMSPAGPYGNLSVLDDTDRNVAYKNLDGKYVLSDEKDAWDAFFREEYKKLEWSIRPVEKNDAEIERSFKHGAVHDAESVYYLCLLFFNRMWLYDKRVKESELADLQAKRGHLFEFLRDRKRHLIERRLPRECFDTDEEVTPFYKMLENIRWYLLVPWFNVASTGKGERYEFHLHDYMQRLLLEEISRMRNNKNHLLVEEFPLSIRTFNASEGQSFADAIAAYFVVLISDQTRKYALPVDRPREMRPEERNKLPDPSGTFWDIYWCKIREKLWLTA
ncbi:hypothetical protein ACEPAG_8484 [Sanghuangporus baumii]